MGDKHWDDCGCGGMCMWDKTTKEDKMKHLEKKEEKLQKMLAHVRDVRKMLEEGKETEEELME
jgi:sulfatase maturation enzyme AslB (radical SAM superfamily)